MRQVRVQRFVFPPYAHTTQEGMRAEADLWQLERTTYFRSDEWMVEDVMDVMKATSG